MKQAFKFTLGADPEFFVHDKKDYRIVPICGKVGGTKKDPLDLHMGSTPLIKGLKYQEDNVAYEGNIPPALTEGEFANYMAQLRTQSNLLLDSKGLSLVLLQGSSNRFNKKELADTPMIVGYDGKPIPQAHLIGCDPDWCAWGKTPTEEDECGDPWEREAFSISVLGDVRHVGGHIHFGFNKELIPDHIFVRMVDAFVYLPHILDDKQTTRRAFYGKAGLYRPKEYGIEYRAMSNWWAINEKSTQIIASKAFLLLRKLHESPHELAEVYAELPFSDIKNAIDAGGDVDGLKELQHKVASLYVQV